MAIEALFIGEWHHEKAHDFIGIFSINFRIFGILRTKLKLPKRL